MNLIIDKETDETFYQSIRRLLGGIEEEELSDEDMLDPTVFDVSEMEILSLLPCLEGGDLTEVEKSRARLAMIHLMASKLCPTVKGMVEYEVKTIDVSWKKKPVDYDTLQASLMNTVESLLQGISCYDDGEEYAGIFKVAPSKKAVKLREGLQV